jgi:hypothetical protein
MQLKRPSMPKDLPLSSSQRPHAQLLVGTTVNPASCVITNVSTTGDGAGFVLTTTSADLTTVSVSSVGVGVCIATSPLNTTTIVCFQLHFFPFPPFPTFLKTTQRVSNLSHKN